LESIEGKKMKREKLAKNEAQKQIFSKRFFHCTAVLVCGTQYFFQDRSSFLRVN
jgi:hypothetical protein